MRNPWIHDDVPAGAASGYGGKVRLLGAFVWGSLLVGVGGAALLMGSGTVELAGAASVRSALTYVVAGAALVLLLPVILRLLAVSRLIAGVAFLGGGWLVSWFVWSRESERIARYLPGDGGFGTGAGSFQGLFELLDALVALL